MQGKGSIIRTPSTAARSPRRVTWADEEAARREQKVLAEPVRLTVRRHAAPSDAAQREGPVIVINPVPSHPAAAANARANEAANEAADEPLRMHMPRSRCCCSFSSCGDALKYVAGVVARGVIGVVPARFAGTGAANWLRDAITGAPGVQRNLLAASQAAVVAEILPLALLSEKLTGPAISAVMTSTRTGPGGDVRTSRAGGRKHEEIVRLLSWGPLALQLGVGACHAFAPSTPDATLHASHAALAMLVYSGLRRGTERLPARLIPPRTPVRSDGRPATAAEVQALHAWNMQPLYAFPFSAALVAGLVWVILDFDTLGIPSSQVNGAGPNWLDFTWAIGVYEAGQTFAGDIGLAIACWRKGMTLEVGRLPDAERALPAAGGILGCEEVEPVISEKHPQARRLAAYLETCLDSIQVASPPGWMMRKVHAALEAFRPDAVTGYRAGVNGALNVLFDPLVAGSVMAVEPGLFIGLSVLLLGIAESWGVVAIQNGMAAAAVWGTPDRVLFDLLHHVFRTVDEVYRLAHDGDEHPDAGLPVIERQVDPLTLSYLRIRGPLAPVVIHLRQLDKADEDLQAVRDPASGWTQYEQPYPEPAMRLAFGSYLAHTPLLPGSRIRSEQPPYSGPEPDPAQDAEPAENKH